MKRIIIYSIVFLIVTGFASGQDLNQTNTRYSPLYLNPALTGYFSGNLRLGATYRDQGDALMKQGYKTMSIFMDSPVSVSFRKYDWIGIGVQLYHDIAGLLPVSTTGIILNSGYHIVFDKKYRNVLSFGFQYGYIQKRIDDKKIILESDYIDPGVHLADRNILLNYNANYTDINFGIHYKRQSGKNNEFSIGIAGYHLLKPTYEGLKTDNYVNRRITFHSNYYFETNKILAFKPEAIVSLSKNAYNIMLQMKSFFKLNKNKKNTDLIYGGIGYRIDDALQLMFGIKYKNIDVGMAYDITVSSAAQLNNGRGGLEIGFYRVFNIPKKIKVIPVLFCPEL